MKFTGKSGVEIIINAAPWKDAKALKKAIETEMVASNIAIEKLDGIMGLIPAILQVDGSEKFDAALWPCLERCLRDSEKITEKTFDDPVARGDYYEILIGCIKVNLGPLVESLLSQLSALGLVGMSRPAAPEPQKSE